MRSGCWVLLGPGPIRQAQGRLDAGMAEEEEDGRVTERVFHKSPNLVLGQAQDERYRFRTVRGEPVKP